MSLNFHLPSIPKFLPRLLRPIRRLIKKPLFLFPLTFLLLLPLTLLSFYSLTFGHTIYPQVQVATINLTGLTHEKARDQLLQHLPPLSPITLHSPTDTFTLSPASFHLEYDFDASVQSAYSIGRTGSLSTRLKQQWQAATSGINLPLSYQLDQSALDHQINLISTQLYIPTVPPQAKLENQQITITPGQSGRELDIRSLKTALNQQFAFPSPSPILPLPLLTLPQELTPSQESKFRDRATTLAKKQLTLSYQDHHTTLTENDLLTLLDPHNQYHQDKLDELVKNWTKGLNRPPQNAKFTFSQNRVTEFQPGTPGITVNQSELTSRLTQALSTLETTPQTQIDLLTPVTETPPTTATQEVNSLGIEEKISQGSSRFRGSISSRIHNIQVAASRLNGLLIPPGTTFSFNDSLGDVSVYTGYQQAYIIKDGQTVLGDGGGVCQVSTTLFRAALNAGLPIIERHAHSYRVGYYEQDTGNKPGLDATVYSPTADLKFKNDTPAHILIQAHVDTRTASLSFELYGTSDGRQIQLGPIKVWDITPAPPDLYIDDPTLAPGTTKQIDWAASGAKSSFTWEVVRDSQILQNKTFYSTYKPWQAKFLRGPTP